MSNKVFILSKFSENRELLKAVYAGNLSQVTNLITQGADIQAKSRINDTPLHLAALNGHEDIIEYLLAQGAPLEVPNSNNDTPLHRAAAKGNVNAFSALVKAKADLSAKNKRGHTPLHLAASEGQLSIVNYVLALRDSASGPLVVRNENDETPLHRAALKGHAQVITALVKGGSDISARNKPGNTPLHLAAASNNNEEVVESLLHSVKGTTEYSSVINALNNIKQTPLHRAAHSGHFNVVKKLLEAGAAVNEKQHDGCTPLHLAITKGISNISIISTPLDAGSDIYKNDETPLHRAAMKGHAQVITALVKGGSDISARNEWGNTPLHLAAASNNNEEVVELLLHSVKGTTEYSSVLNALNNIKQTPLHRAAYCGHLNVVKKLLEAGASVNEKERDGYTPLHLAITKGISHISIISALLDAGSDIYNINNFGNTGAHHAAFNGHITLVESLLSKGFDVNRRNSKGNTLIHLAAHEGHSGMVQLLLTKGAKLDTYNTNEDSPVLMASRLGRTEIVLMLLKAGASPVNPSDGRSVLHAAARGNRLFTCKMILREFGDKVSINSEWKGLTADGYASAAGSAHLAWWLRKKRDSISIESPYRSKWLLCKGDYERSGLNIIKRASTISKRETDWLRKSIEDGTIEMHYMDTDGNTMLHAAVATKNVNTEKALLELGALPIACNHRNESPSTPTVEASKIHYIYF
ncbi:hypothetical protein SK128_002014 [Halocaridina rubra]|uniref:Ankyrin n=1 Tax=Halocaridina rubra TaxID=373956 RepID=A0AAN8XHX1_HALRR